MRVRAVKLTTPRGFDCAPSVSSIGRAAQRATPIALVVALCVILGQVFGHVVEQRRVGSVRAACLLFQAVETARALPTDVSDAARKVSVRFVAEAEAGRRALSDANVECRP